MKKSNSNAVKYTDAWELDRSKTHLWLAALFGAVISFIPWPDIYWHMTGTEYLDRSVYLEQIVSRNMLLTYFSFDTPLAYFTFEFVWAKLMHTSAFTSYLPHTVFFQAISTLTLVGMAIIVAQRVNVYAALLIVNPLIIDLAFSQLRIALAISMLFWIYILRVQKWYVLVPLLLLATMIHTSAILLFLIYILAIETGPQGRFAEWKPRYQITLLVLFGVAVGFAIGPGRELILATLGDRRATINVETSGFLYLAFWNILFIGLCTDLRRTLGIFESRFAVVVLAVVIAGGLSGAYVTRFLAVAFPFLLAAMLGVHGKRSIFFVGLFLIYVVFQWLFYFGVV